MEHAILVIAHNNIEINKHLLQMLDDKRFHFYFLFDKKSQLQPQQFSNIISEATCDFLEPIDINWCGFSYTKAEILLMKAALCNSQIGYFHILQGSDLPLKTADQIDDFFSTDISKNYICFCGNDFQGMKYRMECRHFFVDTPNYRGSRFLKLLDSILVQFQKPFHRQGSTLYYFHQAQYSLTRDFVSYFVNKENEFEKFRYSWCAEECLVGTVIMNSTFRDTVVKEPNTRFIDWTRAQGASPHIFDINDKAMLTRAIDNKNQIFARKFSDNVDLQIADYLLSKIK